MLQPHVTPDVLGVSEGRRYRAANMKGGQDGERVVPFHR